MISRAGCCGENVQNPYFFAYLHSLFSNVFCCDTCCARSVCLSNNIFSCVVAT